MPESVRPLRIFLSYAHADMVPVRRLYNDLRAEGFDVWFDKENLTPGQDWKLIIEKELKRSDVVIVCLSPAAVSTKGYVQREFNFALDQALEMPEGSAFLIPVRLQACEVPERLSRYQWVDLFELAGYQHLIRSLNILAGRQRRPPLVSPTTLRLFLVVLLGALLLTGVVCSTLLFAPGIIASFTVHTPTPAAPTLTPDVFAAEAPTATEIVILPPPPTATEDFVTETPQPTEIPSPTDLPLTFTPTLGAAIPAVDVKVSEKDSMKLHRVPAGSFIMGNNSGGSGEKPAHEVTLDAFWIDETEVTNRMYILCAAAGLCKHPYNSSSSTHPNYYDDPQYADFPVVHVFWKDAEAYCEWAGRELPSEAQWEKAARGADGRLYPWGNNTPTADLLNFNRVTLDTTKVGSYPPGASPYGALDMAGNVWEWVDDWYDPGFYAVSPSINPLGPRTGEAHVLRGGSWNNAKASVRSTSRGSGLPGYINFDIGFRCALPAP